MPYGIGYPMKDKKKNNPHDGSKGSDIEKGFIESPMYDQESYYGNPADRTTVRRRNYRKEYQDEA